MTLQMYEHLSKIAESDTDDIEKQIQMVSVLTGKSVKEVEDLPISVYHDLAKKTVFLMREPAVEQIKSNTVKINERVYVITNDVTKITTAQYIDFQEYMKQGKNLANVLSTLLVPKGEKYGEADFLEVKKDIERLPICTALGLYAFFFAKICEINRQYATLLNVGTEERGGEDESEGADTVVGAFGEKWGWISVVDTVSETKRQSMNETFAQPIIETFNILAYTRDKNEEQRRRIEQQKQMNNGGF